MRASRTSSFSALALLGLAACEPAAVEPQVAETPRTCGPEGPSRVFLIQVMTWGRSDNTTGVSPGFDLDGHVSDADDALGCEVADFTSPDGTPGVDNGFGPLLPTLELTEFMAVEALVAQSISEGNLLISLQLDGVDDLQNDDCVDLTVARATGDVLLGTDGLVESGQTLSQDPALPSFFMEDLAIVDGRLVAQPFEVTLPLDVFDTHLELALSQGAISLDLNEDGTVSGVIGGGTPIGYIMDVVTTENVDAGLEEIMGSLLAAYADLSPDENDACQDISVNFEYEAVPGFLFDE